MDEVVIIKRRKTGPLAANFSSRFYSKNYAAVDVVQSGELQHYISKGEAAGKMPVAYFAPNWWKATHGLNNGKYATAFENFLLDHSNTAPSEGYQTIRQGCFATDEDFQVALLSHDQSPNGLIDFGFIKSQNPHGLAAPDPICLYLRLMGEGASVAPARWFDPAFYLAENQDVSRAGLEPFTHYLSTGLFENRKPCAFLRPKIDVSRYSDKPAFLQSVYSINELLEIEPPFELTRPDLSQLGKSAHVHVPANYFFGEPAIESPEDFDLMIDVYRSYMEAQG